MSKIYVVSKRLFRKVWNAEPYTEEHVMKVFDDYHKVVSYICDSIKNDHKKLDNLYGDLTNFYKYMQFPDCLREGLFINSFDYSDDNYYEKFSYIFHSYVVE